MRQTDAADQQLLKPARKTDPEYCGDVDAEIYQSINDVDSDGPREITTESEEESRKQLIDEDARSFIYSTPSNVPKHK